MKIITLFLLVLLIVFRVPDVMAVRRPVMRISVENTESHVQTRAVRRFADEIKIGLQGKVDVQFFSSARLFRDRDIIQALAQGKVEMAVPGTWHVTRFAPDVGIFLLPMFYGRSADITYAVLDSGVGKSFNTHMEENLDMHVLGRWLDLGHAHLFGVNRAINSHEDIRGLRVRVAGGVANKLRIEGFGGIGAIIPWPDLPEYMKQGRVDAVLTSYETVRSAKLWENGIVCAFEDREYFPQYVPLVRASFWRKLSPEIRAFMTETWEKQVDSSRQMALDAQNRARKELSDNGVRIVVPDPSAIDAWREKIIHLQPEIVKQLGIDPSFVSAAIQQLGEQ